MEAALKVSAEVALQIVSASSFQYSQPHVGAIWFTFCDAPINLYNGKIVSAYYHPTREHTATTKGKLGHKKSVAAAGKWAVSEQTKDWTGNKALYNTLWYEYHPLLISDNQCIDFNYEINSTYLCISNPRKTDRKKGYR